MGDTRPFEGLLDSQLEIQIYKSEFGVTRMEYKLTGDNTKKSNMIFREEIEKIIKEEHVERTRFHEFSKYKYNEIIHKFYYFFCDYKQFSATKVTLSYRRLHFRSTLDHYVVAGLNEKNWNWEEYLSTINSSLPTNVEQKLFLLLEEGWVYEGYADEIFLILKKLDFHINFFVLSNRFDWFIAHDYIDECAWMYCRSKSTDRH